MWGGRFATDTNTLMLKLSQSVSYDKRLYKHDIMGSIAHVTMLGKQGIIPQADADKCVEGLKQIRKMIDEGNFEWKEKLEDVHMNIENKLTELIGDAGGKLHTSRSRNDQVCVDVRMYLRDECEEIGALLRQLQSAMVETAEKYKAVILPGFTHLQHAQPVLFAHYLLAYVEMFDRDIGRLQDCRRRMNVLPLGSGAIAGTTLPIDREFVCKALGFDAVMRNSMDATADRDFAVELLAALSITMMHLSRSAEDLCIYCSQEFSYLELDDAFSTGSSLMPQKKNPDTAELTRGKTGRVYGALMGLLTVMKGLPLCYNRDMQEDKEQLFDAIDTVKLVVEVYAKMVGSLKLKPERMLLAASEAGLMATDLAEWLVKQGVPFRQAHHRVGHFVGYCARKGITLDQASLAEMKESIPEANEECLKMFAPAESVAKRNVTGGTAPEQVEKQVAFWKKELARLAAEHAARAPAH
eukprot:tig00001085_g6964.t1